MTLFFFKREDIVFSLSTHWVEIQYNETKFVNVVSEPKFLAVINRIKWMLKATAQFSQTSVSFL